MNNKKVLSLLQLALRAGKCVMGDRLLKAITSRKASLVVYSDEIGANSRKKILNKCQSFHVQCIELPHELMEQLSNKRIMALAILDPGFAGAIEREVEGRMI